MFGRGGSTAAVVALLVRIQAPQFGILTACRFGERWKGAGKLPENKNKKTLFWRGWRDGGKQKERVALHMLYPPEHNFAYYSALLFSRYFTDSIPTYSVERRGEEREKLLVTSQQ
jgi:hypothetical protein